MYVTNQTNYALRILMYCALRGRRRSTIPQIAATYHISEAHLFKILPILSQEKLVHAVRGRNGGITLAKTPADISIGAVVRATEERFTLAECFDQQKVNCPLVGICRLRGVWDDALRAFLAVLDKYTLADLIANPTSLQKSLGIEELNEDLAAEAVPVTSS